MARHLDATTDVSNTSITRIDAAESGSVDRIVVSDTQFLFSAKFKKAGGDLILTGEDGAKLVVSGYFNHEKRPDLAAPGGAFLSGDLVERLAGPENPGQYAQAGAPAGAAVIGRVERVGGSAIVQRANGVVEELKIGDSIRQGDIVETRDGSTLGISFIDGTAFNMGASARMSISELVYDSSSTSNSAVFSLVRGAISFVAGQAAKTGDMRVETPVATMGIRGTSVNTTIETDVNGQTVSVTYSLMQDPDGKIGAFSIIDPVTRAVIGSITTTDSTFTVTPTPVGLNALLNPKTAQDIAQELAVAQALFPIFLANPANFNVNVPPQDVQPKSGTHGSSTPPGGSTQPSNNSTHTTTPTNTQTSPTNNNSESGNGGTTTVVLPPKLLPSVFADIPEHLIEGVTLGDAGVATSVSHIFRVDLDGTASFDTSGWLDIGSGIFSKAGIYGIASLNTGGATADGLIASGWTSLGNGLFQKDVFFDSTGQTETVRVSLQTDTLTYALDNARADGLGPGDHPTETFVINVIDNDGQTASTTVVYTVDGRNDPPELNPDPGSPHLENEVADTTNGDDTLALDGTLTFSDPELDQSHTVDPFFKEAVWSGATPGHGMPAATQTAIQSALDAFLLSDSTGTGTGHVSWTFSLEDHLVDFLRAGETLTLTYNVITIRDDLDASSSQPVTVVITGTNDRPVLAADVSGSHAIVELVGTSGSDTAASFSGVLNFTDVDLNDTHVASAALVAGGAVWSGGGNIPFASLAAVSIAMSASVATGMSGDSTHTGSGSLTWNFNLQDQYLDFLGNGETLTLTYAVTVLDDSGAGNASAMQYVTITATGTNDLPLLSIADADVSLDQDTYADIIGAHVSDPDVADVLTATLHVANGLLTLLGSSAGLSSIAGVDTDTITIMGSAAAIDAAISAGLRYTPASGFDGSDSLAISISDGQGGTQNQSISIDVVSSIGKPQTNPATANVDEDGAVAITLTGTDSDGVVTSFKIVDIGNLNGALYSDSSHTQLLHADDFVAASPGGSATVYFVPSENYNGQATFTFAARDDDGLNDPSPATATITVSPVNDAPAVEEPASHPVTDEDQPVVITGLSVADVDGNPLTVQLTATSTITLATTAGLTGLVGNGSSSLSFTGSVAAINAALNGLIYSPAQDFSGVGSISYSVTDGVAPPATGVIPVNVLAVNDAPVLHVSSQALLLNQLILNGGVGAAADIDYANGHVYIVGNAPESLDGNAAAWVNSFAASQFAAQAWSGQLDWQFGNFFGVEATGSGVYAVGYSHPDEGLTTDGVGGNQIKSIATAFDIHGQPGTGLPSLDTISSTDAPPSNGYTTQNFFTGVLGQEQFHGGTIADDTSTALYAVGEAATDGSGHTAFVVAKYDSDTGARLAYAVGALGVFQTANNALMFNDSLFVVGAGGVTQAGATPTVWRFDNADLNNAPVAHTLSELPPGEYTAIAASLENTGEYFYAVGHTVGNTTGDDALVVKFDENGNSLWTTGFDLSYSQFGDTTLTDVVTIDGRVFIVGYADGFTGSGTDAFMLELGTDGSIESFNFYPGFETNDRYNAIATDGKYLYIVGQSDSQITPGETTPIFEVYVPSHTVIESGVDANGNDLAGIQSSVVYLAKSDWDNNDQTSFDTSGWTAIPQVSNLFTMSGIYGHAFLDTYTQTLTYILDDDDPDTQALLEGQHVTETFTVSVNDDLGALASQNVSFDIIGTHDETFVNVSVLTGAGYDTSTFYSIMADQQVTANHDESGFLTLGDTTQFAFQVHGYNFEYSGPVNAPDIDAGTITGIDILTSGLAPFVSMTGLNIDIAQLDAALNQYENSAGSDTALLDDIFKTVAYHTDGGSGPDILSGGRLNDVLAGHAGDDTFHFEPGSGHDIIVGFTAGAGTEDVIGLGSPGHAFNHIPTDIFGNVDLVAWQINGGLEQSGNDVLLHLSVTSAAEWGANTDLDTIRLQNVIIGNLHASDFHAVFQI